MESRCKGCALATEGDVTAPEVGYAGDAGFRDDYIRITDLQRIRQVGAGTMPNSLAVIADSTDIGFLDFCQIKRPVDDVGVGGAKLDIEPAQIVEAGSWV